MQFQLQLTGGLRGVAGVGLLVRDLEEGTNRDRVVFGGQGQ